MNIEPSVSDTQLNISVVMCAYTEIRWDDMAAAIESLKAQMYPPYEIILVIDHNSALFQRAQTQLADVRVVENQRQKGLSGARNSGVAIAQGDIIAFMDEDALAAPDWLAQLEQIYADPQVMGVGGAIRPSWEGEQPKWFPEEFEWVVGCTYRGMPDTQAPVRNLIGCNMSFRKSICDHNGDFRDGIGRVGTLPMGCEETEYCIRANQRWPQKTLIYNPEARVLHKVPGSRATWRYFCSRCYAEGISKALISQFVGSTSSLSSEKTYVLKTLPKAVLRSLRRAVLRLDANELAKVAAIVTGLSLTAFGYVSTKMTTGIKQKLSANYSIG